MSFCNVQCIVRSICICQTESKPHVGAMEIHIILVRALYLREFIFLHLKAFKMTIDIDWQSFASSIFLVWFGLCLGLLLNLWLDVRAVAPQDAPHNRYWEFRATDLTSPCRGIESEPWYLEGRAWGKSDHHRDTPQHNFCLRSTPPCPAPALPCLAT